MPGLLYRCRRKCTATLYADRPRPCKLQEPEAHVSYMCSHCSAWRVCTALETIIMDFNDRSSLFGPVAYRERRNSVKNRIIWLQSTWLIKCMRTCDEHFGEPSAVDLALPAGPAACLDWRSPDARTGAQSTPRPASWGHCHRSGQHRCCQLECPILLDLPKVPPRTVQPRHYYPAPGESTLS